jgi:hypothetical protein
MDTVEIQMIIYLKLSEEKRLLKDSGDEYLLSIGNRHGTTFPIRIIAYCKIPHYQQYTKIIKALA